MFCYSHGFEGLLVSAKIIAIANQKGGVGKTTTSVNLAASLVAARVRVLLVDLDPQGNASMGSGIDKSSIEVSINEVLLDNDLLFKALITTTPAGFALLPANGDLTEAEVKLLRDGGGNAALKNALMPAKEDYDFILIDCPPSLNMLTVNALVAADSVIVPMQCEYYALEGLSALLDTVKQISGSVNP